jgi:hypothetical protein
MILDLQASPVLALEELVVEGVHPARVKAVD